MNRAFFILALAGFALTLTGCWTPPNANVQPPGRPRLIQSGVVATDNHFQAALQSIDMGQRVLKFQLADGTTFSCTASPSVANFEQLKPGDQLKVDLTLPGAKSIRIAI